MVQCAADTAWSLVTLDTGHTPWCTGEVCDTDSRHTVTTLCSAPPVSSTASSLDTMSGHHNNARAQALVTTRGH